MPFAVAVYCVVMTDGQLERLDSSEADDEVDKPYMDILERFNVFVEETQNVANTQATGAHALLTLLSVVSEIPKLLTTAPLAIRNSTQELADAVNGLDVERETAEKQIASEFRSLNTHLFVGAWGMIESTIEDFAIARLLAVPDLLKTDDLRRVKISLADFQTLDTEIDRYRYLVGQLQTSLRSESKRGVGQFESLLNPLGISGPVHPELRQVILVAQQTRHVVAHRGGIADRKLIEACPNEGFVLGESVYITRDTFVEWMEALINYVHIVWARCVTLNRRKRIGMEIESTKTARIWDYSFPTREKKDAETSR